MTLLHIIIVALVQGITEFLPISSSGHLLLVHEAFGKTAAENIIMDIAVHIGTLFAVLLYFRADIKSMLCGFFTAITKREKSEGTKLSAHIIISSTPVVAAGFVLYVMGVHWANPLEIIGWTTIIFGIFLWVADAKGSTTKTLKDMGWRDALMIGLAQAVALIPGTSRSGITMTAARFLGYSRTESAHYSLLLAIVAITGAGIMAGIDVVKNGGGQFTYDVLLAAALAFAVSWAAIGILMKWLERSTFKIFAIYRVILGAVLLAITYGIF